MRFVILGQAHEGSSYASQKLLQMAWHRTEHARTKVADLERSKNQLLPPVRYISHLVHTS